jgi:sulfatase modifying factor 1
MIRRGAFVAVLALGACSGQNAPAPLGTRAQCAAYAGVPAGWGSDAHAGMVHVAGGAFELGSERGYAEERPLASREVAPFWIDRTEVTNAQFASFVKATGYVTAAERGGDGAVVFREPAPTEVPAPNSWWHLQPGADWKHPDGAATHIDGRAHEPAVDLTYADALAYARWLGRALPDELQWEFAAKAGRANEVADRDVRDGGGANFWQGLFPYHDAAVDGFDRRAPVGCYAANALGLHDMVGNVWEWTADLWTDAHAPGAAPVKDRQVIKGGSFLCADNYCARARASSRQGQESDLPAAHVGFRTIAVDGG